MSQHKQLQLLGIRQPSRQQMLVERRERLIKQLADSVRNNQLKKSRKVLCRLNQTAELIRLYCEVESGRSPGPAAGQPTYLVSSLFLYDCFRELTADRKEQLFFVTGPEVSGTLVLDQRLRFAHERRSVGGVTGSHPDTHRALIMLEEFRHRLIGHMHSHPTMGRESTTPSGIDMDFQRRLERAGHVAVAAIFSRDGWIRFFRGGGPLEVRVYGEGVEQHEANIFRLTKLYPGRR